jgi:hypothetical protein
MSEGPDSSESFFFKEQEEDAYVKALKTAMDAIAGRGLRRPKKIVTEESEQGHVYTRDECGRPCWDPSQPQRVLLLHDLRRHNQRLHAGLLGTTLVGATDGYRCIGVDFDNGAQVVCSSAALQAVRPEDADELAMKMVEANRGTRFDADPSVADVEYRKWLEDEYGDAVDFMDIEWSGEGPDEVYAYTFESLRLLAAAQNQDVYPIKIGYSGTGMAPSITRIASQIRGNTSLPERAVILAIHRTNDGRSLEMNIHRQLRAMNARKKDAMGREWFMASLEMFRKLSSSAPESPRAPRPLSGEVAREANYYNEFRNAMSSDWATEWPGVDMTVRVLVVHKLGAFTWVNIPFRDLFETPAIPRPDAE